MLCRLCLYDCSGDNAVFLFKNGDELNLTKLIAKYMHIEITKNDDVSTNICKDCLQHLNSFHTFAQFVEERQKVLKNEFLEVKCDVVEFSMIKKVPQTYDHQEETQLDIKDCNSEIEIPLDQLSPQTEFGCAGDESLDSDGLGNGHEADGEINLPLKTTKTKLAKRLPSKTHKVKSRNLKSKRKAAKSKEDENNASNAGETSKRSIFTPEDNKFRDDLIAKHIELKCEICGIVLNKLRFLKAHYRTKHNTRGYVTCCGKRFIERFLLMEHLQIHLDPETFKCNLCEKVYKSRVCLQSHKKKQHKNKKELKHACTFCEKRFAYQSNLTAHMLVHNNERKSICEICDKGFKTDQILKVHMRAMHENTKPYICDTCGREYKFKPSFERHVAEHQGLPIEPIGKCPICGIMIMSNRRRHMNTHNVKDVECKICGKKLSSKSSLEAHIGFYHRKQRTFACTFCDKTFKRPSVLKEHIAMHTGAKDYNCPHCPREFRSKANMYAHIKKIHVEEWSKAQLARKLEPNKGQKNEVEQKKKS